MDGESLENRLIVGAAAFVDAVHGRTDPRKQTCQIRLPQTRMGSWPMIVKHCKGSIIAIVSSA
jgi:hypothetical protein